jgi:hypothetical protein
VLYLRVLSHTFLAAYDFLPPKATYEEDKISEQLEFSDDRVS